MIIKSVRQISGAEYAVNYLFKGMPDNEEDRWAIFQNIDGGFGRNEIAKQFNANAKFLNPTPRRRKTQRYHEILAFSHKNNPDLSREILQDIANKYLELRDKEKGSVALCVPHLDKHAHIHVLLSSNNLLSKKSGDRMMNNAEYYEIRREMERWVLKTYPFLHHSTVHLPEEEIQRLLPDKYKAERRLEEKKTATKVATAKEKAADFIKRMLEKSKSLEDFVQKVNQTEVYRVYFRRGKPTGIVHENKKKFRFTTLGVGMIQEHFSVLTRMSELKEIERRSDRRSLER